MTDEPDMDPQSYYDEFGEDEWERLDRDPVTRMEFENTTDYLAEYLPDAESQGDSAGDTDSDSDTTQILDVGGAAGRYACWLAERGYDVTLVDLSPEQVELAREKATERGVEE